MRLGGARRNDQRFRNLTIGGAPCKEAEDLQLPRRHIGKRA